MTLVDVTPEQLILGLLPKTLSWLPGVPTPRQVYVFRRACRAELSRAERAASETFWCTKRLLKAKRRAHRKAVRTLADAFAVPTCDFRVNLPRLIRMPNSGLSR
jgi:hypothetical protein